MAGATAERAGRGRQDHLDARPGCAAAHRSRRRVLVLAPTGKAVDVAVREGAGDAGYTVAKALKSLEDGTLTLDRQTLVVVDEAGHGRHRRSAPPAHRHHHRRGEDRAGR